MSVGLEPLAFAMEQVEFESIIGRLESVGIEFGDVLDAVGNMWGPAAETGARGMAKVVYCLDPNRHLIEIGNYDTENA